MGEVGTTGIIWETDAGLYGACDLLGVGSVVLRGRRIGELFRGRVVIRDMTHWDVLELERAGLISADVATRQIIRVLR